MPAKIIVTGVAGFIGSTIAQRLLDRGDHVIGIDCITDYYPEKLKRANLEPLLGSDSFEFIEKNIVDLDLAPLLDGAKTVFHQAAQAGVRASWGKSFEVYTNLNVLTTQVLLEAAKGTGARVVYASSSSVYGDSPLMPMHEDHAPAPLSPYGVTKLAAEHLCCLYAKAFKVHTVSLRYFTVYGPKQRPDMAFNKFIRATLTNQPITLFGDGDQTRDFTFIADIVEANLLAAERGAPGGVYNIGGGSRISMNKVIEKLGGILGRPLDVRNLDTQKGDMRHTFADTTRAREELGFTPKVSLDEGLAREAEWMENCLALSV